MQNHRIVSRCSRRILRPGKQSLDSKMLFPLNFGFCSCTTPRFSICMAPEGFLQWENTQNDQKMQNGRIVSKCSRHILRSGKQSLDSNKTFLSPKF